MDKHLEAKLHEMLKVHVDEQLNYKLEKAIQEQKAKYDNDKYFFDEDEARKLFKFLSKLTLDKGKKGQKIKLLKFQFIILSSLLCVKHRDTGFRRFKEAHLNIGRKNGKGSLVAWVIIYLFFTSTEYGAEYILIANDLKQATNLFNTIMITINANKTLKKYCKITESKKMIYRKHTNSTLRVLANEGSNLDSYASFISVLDEVHEYKKTDAYEKLLTGSGLWDSPIMFTTTTASAGEDENNLEYQMYTYSKQLEAKEIEDETFYYAIYEAEKDCDLWNIEEWFKANPALGIFKKIDDFIKLCKKAGNMKTFEAKFRRLYLNQHINIDGMKGAIDMELWNDVLTDIDLKDLKGWDCWCGLDLSSKNDITAFVLVFYNQFTEEYLVYPIMFTPYDSARERGERDKYEYLKYIKSNELIGTRGQYVNFEDMLDKLYELDLEVNIKQIGFDRWGSSTIMNRLEQKWDVIDVAQSVGKMSPVINDFENLLIDKKVKIANNTVFSHMAKNTTAIITDGGIRFSKTKSEFKIDGIIAMLMALILAIEANGMPTYNAVKELEDEDWD